jgi:beta-galactosidase/beta-glucuronidase
VDHNIVGWIRGRDPTRLIHYEGGGSRTSSTDIVCPMYMRVWDILKIAKDPSENRPLILCEYVICGATPYLILFVFIEIPERLNK